MTEVSKTELALQALLAALTGPLLAAGFPEPMRNETLDVLLENIGEGTGCVINVIDGNGDVPSETMGAYVSEDGYEIEHRAEIEFLLADADADQRDKKFDIGLVTIADAIKAALGGAEPHTLGGAVSDAQLVSPIERSNPRTDGLPGIKYALITVQMTFLSSRIF